MEKYYRVEGDASVEPFNAIRGGISVSAEELVKGDARTLFALKAVELAEDMIAMWEAVKDKVVFVEEK